MIVDESQRWIAKANHLLIYLCIINKDKVNVLQIIQAHYHLLGWIYSLLWQQILQVILGHSRAAKPTTNIIKKKPKTHWANCCLIAQLKGGGSRKGLRCIFADLAALAYANDLAKNKWVKWYFERSSWTWSLTFGWVFRKFFFLANHKRDYQKWRHQHSGSQWLTVVMDHSAQTVRLSWVRRDSRRVEFGLGLTWFRSVRFGSVWLNIQICLVLVQLPRRVG